MPAPKIWETPADLVLQLKKGWHERVQEPCNVSADWEMIIKCAVSSNTFRAFRGLPKHPSKVFRSWALDVMKTRAYFGERKAISTQEGYDRWLGKLVIDFRNTWNHEMGQDIPFGPSYKLPNLLMKKVCLKLTAPEYQKILPLLHVPLDSYTLLGIRNCFKLPDGRMIPKAARMGFVDSPAIYRAAQKCIGELASRAGVPPIAYDYLAWDAGHGAL